MKYLKLAFGLVAVAGLMAISTSSAMAAEPIWVTCAKTAAPTHYTEADCLTAGSEGGWNTKGFAANETIEATSSGTLTLEDRSATGGKVRIECEGTDQGWVGPNGVAEQNRVTASSCKFVEHGSCEESKKVTAAAVNLPWTLKLEERENPESSNKVELRGLLVSLVSGKNPGWDVECTVGGILKIADECTGRTSVGVESARSRLLTNFNFDKISEQEPAKCSLGGEKSGFVKGIVSSSIRNKNHELQALWPLASILNT
jgi:hypothetical protein